MSLAPCAEELSLLAPGLGSSVLVHAQPSDTLGTPVGPRPAVLPWNTGHGGVLGQAAGRRVGAAVGHGAGSHISMVLAGPGEGSRTAVAAE